MTGVQTCALPIFGSIVTIPSIRYKWNLMTKGSCRRMGYVVLRHGHHHCTQSNFKELFVTTWSFCVVAWINVGEWRSWCRGMVKTRFLKIFVFSLFLLYRVSINNVDILSNHVTLMFFSFTLSKFYSPLVFDALSTTGWLLLDICSKIKLKKFGYCEKWFW